MIEIFGLMLLIVVSFGVGWTVGDLWRFVADEQAAADDARRRTDEFLAALDVEGFGDEV